jgi:hypothetical protein
MHKGGKVGVRRIGLAVASLTVLSLLVSAPFAASAAGVNSPAAKKTTGIITGKVIAAAHKKALSEITVVVFSRGGDYLASAFTGTSGAFRITGLKPSAGDLVCFDASAITSGTGYVSQCFKNAAWTPTSPPPFSARPVRVRAGKTIAGVNASLTVAGGLSGSVSAANGGRAITGVTVDVFTPGGAFLASAATSGAGKFEVTGLTPTAKGGKGDTVCFDATSATASPGSGPSAGPGLASQCYKNVAWTSSSLPPANVTGVAVAAGKVTTRVNASLAAGGAIRGSVTAGGHHTGAGGVTVDVFSSAGALLGSAVTSAKGQYTVQGLPAATGDAVCFDATSVAKGGGYVSQCYRGQAWTPPAAPAPGAAKVNVVAGSTTPGVNATLVPGGAISGTVTSGPHKSGVAGVAVVVFAPSGKRAGLALTSANGSYKVTGLASSARGYAVCFDTRFVTGFHSQCYRGISWDPSSSSPSARAKRVKVAVGHIQSGINASLK